MELALPIIVLGGMYVISNQDNTKPPKKEGFIQNNTTLTKNQVKALPNTNTQPRNFPTNGISELKENPKYYPSPNAATDKYFQQSVYEEKAESNTNMYKSLTGNNVSTSDLKHNNMVPFFGSKVTQLTSNYNNNESRLDNMNGSGSQRISKREMAPLFKPEQNMQWAHGTPNTSDFIQSRINPSTSMANVKPFQEVRVGPALNQQDGVLGSGGFNSGMAARERWIPKSVDELRTANNPKVTYGGVILGGKSDVTNRGIMGKMEKNRPDTYFINSPERYFTTTGLQKAQTARGIELLKPENRETTTQEYFGTAGEGEVEASYVSGKYQQPMRPQLDPNIKHITNAYHKGGNTGDNGFKGYKDSVLGNNRMLTTRQEYGAVSSFAKAIVAPLMDLLRPTRKENVVGNLRPSGNAATAVTAGVVYNPAERTKTTIREMTENRPDHMFVNNQQGIGGYGYTVNEQQPTYQQRDTTGCEYIGIGGNTGATSNAPTYNAAYNAHLINKEPISRGRVPTTSNAPLFNGESNTNIHIDKRDCDRNNNRMWVPQQVTSVSATTQQIGSTTTRSEYGLDINCQRNQSNILDAFNSNPYTKSLQSWA